MNTVESATVHGFVTKLPFFCANFCLCQTSPNQQKWFIVWLKTGMLVKWPWGNLGQR